MTRFGVLRRRALVPAGTHVRRSDGLVAVAATSRKCRHYGMIVALVGLAALAAGCATGSSSSNQSGRPEKTSIVVGAVPAADSAGLYIAEQHGFFAAEGLHVKIVPIISAELAISQQLAGGYDITLGNYVSYIQADAEHSAGLRIIAEGSVIQADNQELVTLPGSRIASLSGLKGATLAVNVPNNIGNILIGSALEGDSLSIRDVKLVAIPFPLMMAALKDHKVQAAWMPEPFLSLAEQQIGAREILDLDQGSVAGFPIVGYAVTRAYEQRYPKTVAAFTRALERGQEIADTSRAAVEKAVEAFLGMPSQTAALMSLPTFPLGVDRVRLQRVADAMQHFSLLKQPFNVSQTIG